MSIFNRMKAKKEKDMAAQEPQPEPPVQPQPQQPVQQPPVQQPVAEPPKMTQGYPMPPNELPDGTPFQAPQYQQPKSIQPPQTPEQTKSLYEKLTTKEVQEEIMTITDEEKREFIFIFEDKYRTLYKEMNQIMMKIEDVKISEKQKLEEVYRKQVHQIDEKYEKQKKLVEEKYSKHLERFKALADKFKEHVDIGGLQDENKSRTQELPRTEPYRVATPPGPEIDQTYFTQDREDPEISRLIRELDDKLESRSLLKK